MAAAMNQLEIVKKILTESTNIICDNLAPSDLLRTMKSKNALTTNDATRIRSKVVDADQAELMLEILMKKPTTAYDAFMDALLERAERKDIYTQIKNIEAKHGYIRQVPDDDKPRDRPAAVPTDPDAVKPSHISDFIGQLDSDQLSSVYEQLDIEYTAVKKAHERAGTTDPDRRAKEVLRFWKEQNGKKATRSWLLKALEKCSLVNAKETLEVQWAE